MNATPDSAYRGDEPFAFASYAHADSERVFADMRMLQADGIRLYYDEGIRTGAVWRDELANAIVESRVMVFFVSEASLASQHCLAEVYHAVTNDTPVVAVFLDSAQLPPGLEMNLGYKQSIMRYELEHTDYIGRLNAALKASLAAVRGDTQSQRISIGVLPFLNPSEDADLEWLADGLAEELILGLQKQSDLRVLSRNSSFSVRGSNDDAVAMGKRLGVAQLLQGSIRAAGERLRINVWLVETRAGAQLWSERYDTRMGDLFDVQDAIADQVLGALPKSFDRQRSDRVLHFGTENIDAYKCYLMGKYEQRQYVPERLSAAEGHYRAALDLDPDFPQAWLCLMETLEAQRMFYDDDPAITSKRSEEIVLVQARLRAMAETIHSVNWHWIRRNAGPGARTQWNFDAEERLYQAMIVDSDHPARRGLNPDRWAGGGFIAQPDNHSAGDGLAYYGLLLGQAGLYRTGIAYLLPANPTTSAVGCMYIASGQLSRARVHFADWARRDPAAVLPRILNNALLLRLGEDAAAQADQAGMANLLNDDLVGVLRTIRAYWSGDRSYLDSNPETIAGFAIPALFKGILTAMVDVSLAPPHFEKAFANDEVLLKNLRLWGPGFLAPEDWQALEREAPMASLMATLGLTDNWRSELFMRARSLRLHTGIEPDRSDLPDLSSGQR